MASEAARITVRAVRMVAVAVLTATACAWGAEPPPARPMPEGGRELCVTCHDDFASQLEGPVQHAPVAADRCTACHSPHAARHGKLLRRAGNDLCLGCHATVQTEVNRPVVHEAVREKGGCLSCHLPHTAAEAHLLKQPPKKLCTSCHEDLKGKLEGPGVHAPVRAGACGTCHLPHGGSEAALLKAAPEVVCSGCHKVDSPAMKTKHRRFSLANADCGSCHDPHASSNPGLVRPTIHPPFEEGCDTCHAAPEKPAELLEPVPGLCLECHDDKAAYAESSPGQHPTGNAVSCTGCHSPHAGEGEGMLRGPERQVCLGCHVEIRKAIDRGKSFHPLTVEGGRCTACHRPHGAEGKFLLAKPETELCVGCHPEHSRFAHPMGPNVPDASRPGKSLTCLSCHAPHASDQKMMLRASPAQALCVRCHKDLHD